MRLMVPAPIALAGKVGWGGWLAGRGRRGRLCDPGHRPRALPRRRRGWLATGWQLGHRGGRLRRSRCSTPATPLGCHGRGGVYRRGSGWIRPEGRRGSGRLIAGWGHPSCWRAARRRACASPLLWFVVHRSPLFNAVVWDNSGSDAKQGVGQPITRATTCSGPFTPPLRGHASRSVTRMLVRHACVTVMSVLVRHVDISHLAPDVDPEIVTVRGERKER